MMEESIFNLPDSREFLPSRLHYLPFLENEWLCDLTMLSSQTCLSVWSLCFHLCPITSQVHRKKVRTSFLITAKLLMSSRFLIDLKKLYSWDEAKYFKFKQINWSNSVGTSEICDELKKKI